MLKTGNCLLANNPNFLSLKKTQMNISVDISYYPLKEEFIPPIKSFIDRLNRYEGLRVQTDGMSTQVFGDYDLVFDTLKTEIRNAFEVSHSVFIMKVINADLDVKIG
jgi:uncharacterized protein YqgV (UPF0045/DUF77 family)